MPWPAKKRRVRLTYLVATVEPPPVPRPEVGGDVVEVFHVATSIHASRHRDHDVAVAEAERQDELDLRLPVGDRLLDLVAPGDAEMHGAGADLARDLGRREVGDLDAGEARDAARDSCGRCPPARGRARPREERRGVLLQPSLGGDGEDRAARSWLRSALPTRSSQIEKPIAGTRLAARRSAREQAVVAAAADDLARRSGRGASWISKTKPV